jgi:glycerophosphoryl diester phosphodiesterase
MILVGHRGCASQYPENTITAVTSAAPHVDRIEIDVRRCGTGELVVIRDATVDRVTYRTGIVREMSWDVLRGLEVLDSGDTIPLFDELLERTPDSTGLHVDIKEDGIGAKVVAAIERIGIEAYVCADDPERLREVNATGWTGPIGLIFRSNPETSLVNAVDLGCQFVEIHHTLCRQTDVVAKAHEEGLTVIGGGSIEDRSLVSTLSDIGVDGVMINRWDIAGQGTA